MKWEGRLIIAQDVGLKVVYEYWGIILCSNEYNVYHQFPRSLIHNFLLWSSTKALRNNTLNTSKCILYKT
jgi:hypothetical protein